MSYLSLNDLSDSILCFYYFIKLHNVHYLLTISKTNQNASRKTKKCSFISNTVQSLQIKVQQQRSNLRKLKLQQQITQSTKFKQISKPILPTEMSLGTPNIFCIQARREVKIITEFPFLKTCFVFIRKYL